METHNANRRIELRRERTCIVIVWWQTRKKENKYIRTVQNQSTLYTYTIITYNKGTLFFVYDF